MKSRIVTVSLAVAMGLWLNIAAYSQTEEQPPISIVPEEGLDELESDLPLKGLPIEPLTDESFTSELPLPSDVSAVPRDGEWLYALRRTVSLAPWNKIGLGASGVFAAGVMLWAAFASGKRSRRAYRRPPRSSGGPRLRNLQEVVESVQFGRSTPDGPAGRECPR